MATVSEILQQAGLTSYEINSIDPKLTNAFGRVLSEAELQKTSVDEFWANTYNPGIAQWEQEKSDLGRRLAAAESQRTAYERERQVLIEQGLVTGDNFSQPRSSGGQMQTPGTPSFVDPNEIVSRAGQGLTQLADIEWKHKNIFGKPMNIPPSQLVAEADRQGISLAEAAERKFGFSKREQELRESKIRQEAETKVRKEFAEKGGSNPDLRQPSGSAQYADTRRAVEKGEMRDPTRMTQAERRQQALNSIHKAVEERQQRDA
jgi:hypothetical protein